MDDGLIYENGKIRITKNVFANGQGENFVIPSLRAIREERSGKSVVPLFLALACIGLALFTDMFQYSRYAFGALAVFLLIVQLRQQEKFTVFLTGPQGEVAAFRTRDPETSKQVTTCLLRAVSLHR